MIMVNRTPLPQPYPMSWYALRIQSRLSGLASITLRGKGYEEFLPLYRACRRWSDRVKQVELPLFPGYSFCQFDVNDRLPILTTPGVIGIVGAGKTRRRNLLPGRTPATPLPRRQTPLGHGQNP